MKHSRLSKYVPVLLGMVVLLLALSGCGCDHNFGDWAEETAATCTDEGTMIRVCSICNRIQLAVIPATDHSYGDWVEEIPGIRTITCIFCGDTKTEHTA